MTKKVTPKVISAVGTATSSGEDVAKKIEEAMVTAVKAQQASGETDTNKIKAAMMLARENVLAEEKNT